MNFKSQILKLTIIMMLVLVLVPAVSAENSTESFFVEYDVADDEVYVEECTFSEVYFEEDAQVETSTSHEIDSVSPIDHQANDVSCGVNETIKISDDVNVITAEEESALDPQDIIIDDEKESAEILCSDFSEISNDINESREDDFILETQSIDCCPVDISISKFNVMSNHLFHLDKLIFCSSFSYNTTNFGRNLLKNLDTKDNLLNDNWACIYYAVNSVVVIELNDAEIIEKHIGDFAYSIDNAIFGDECGLTFDFLAIFSNFNPVYDDDFLYKTVDEFFDDFLKASMLLNFTVFFEN